MSGAVQDDRHICRNPCALSRFRSISRDPKGSYAATGLSKAAAIPGPQVPYEPPLRPELIVDVQASPD